MTQAPRPKTESPIDGEKDAERIEKEAIIAATKVVALNEELDRNGRRVLINVIIIRTSLKSWLDFSLDKSYNHFERSKCAKHSLEMATWYLKISLASSETFDMVVTLWDRL